MSWERLAQHKRGWAAGGPEDKQLTVHAARSHNRPKEVDENLTSSELPESRGVRLPV